MTDKLYERVDVVVHINGTVRVYGNGGMLYEVQGKYVRVETYVDPKLQPPSGTNG